jgi:hypothetical protein
VQFSSSKNATVLSISRLLLNYRLLQAGALRYAATAISRLFRLGCPANVAGLIIAVIFDAID